MRVFPILLIVFSGVAVASDLFWITLGGDDNDGIYLMQIDATGKVTRAPKLIASESKLGGDCDCTTAMTPLGSSKIVIWSNNEIDQVYRTVVDKATMTADSVRKTYLTQTDEDGITASQTGPRSFVAIEVGYAVFKAYGIGPDGNLDGTSWRFMPRLDHGLDEGSVAADGMMGVANTDNTDDAEVIYTQTYKNTGLPAAKPRSIGTTPLGYTESREITSLLPNGTRWVLYRDTDADKIYLQKVDGMTGAKLGAPKFLIDSDPEETDQSIAIDPHGRFFVYNDYDSGCPDDDIVRYLALDASGNPVGSPKTIAGCDFITAAGFNDDILGIDILQD